MDLPSVKHHAFHECAYCTYHVRTSGQVPSVDKHGFIATYNLLHLLKALDMKMALEHTNKVLGWDWTAVQT